MLVLCHCTKLSQSCIELLNSHIVFDELHELIKIHGLNLLFTELVIAKKLRGLQANTLLVSATTNPLFLTKVLELQLDDIIGIPTFNQSPYQIQFNTYDDTGGLSPLVTGERNSAPWSLSPR